MKKVVNYSTLVFCEEGCQALVFPVDHPDHERVTNEEPARTSAVIRYDAATGEFETLNTLYRKQDAEAAAQALVERAPKLSIRNRTSLAGAARMGCYFCMQLFPANTVEEWADDGETAVCPYCNVDALIAETPSVQLNEELLARMMERWFTRPVSVDKAAAIDKALGLERHGGTQG